MSIVRESINFERGLDPKHSMKIGKKALIIKWFSNLDIDESRYEILPDLSIKVNGNLDLSNTQITSLPDNLSVGRNLNLSNTQITSLPDNLTIGGDLYLSNTQITSLPDNLSVGRNLNLSNTQITSLPDNLTVEGWLDLRNTQITSLPDNLTIGGDLYLRNTQITSLPDNLSVGGGLYLNNTPITSLPDNLSVGGGLYLSNTPITSLPPSLKVKGKIVGFKEGIVKESLNFERGLDPKKAMGLGSKMLQMIKDLHNEFQTTMWNLFGRPEDRAGFALKGTLMQIYFDKEDPSKAFTKNCRKMNCTVDQIDLIQTILQNEFDLEVKYLGDGR